MRKLLSTVTLLAFATIGLLAQSSGGAFIPSIGYTFSGNNTFSGANAFTGVATLTSPVLTSPTVTGTTSIGAGATLTSPLLVTPAVGVVTDTGLVNRLIPNPTAKTIVDGSATSLFEVAIAAASYAAGTVHFAVFASDATDHQVISGILTYSGENKAGTIVRAATYVAANEAKSVSSGTLTLSFTATDDTNKMTVKLQPTGSLTETTYTVLYTVVPLKGTVTIL
jgi:hypothetical protein